jgi:hypothetical protein
VRNRIVTGGIPELLTMHDVGGYATILTGVLPPKLMGIEPYTSEWVREDVNNAGVYAAVQVLTTALLVKKSRFVIGQRAPIRIWATPSLASSDKMLLSAKERFTFGAVPQSASELSIVVGYNIAK